MDEEIDSDIADDIDMDEEEDQQQTNRKSNVLANDEFFTHDDQNETVEERKLRMTKQLLQEL